MHSYTSKSDLLGAHTSKKRSSSLCVRWYLRYKLSYRDLVEMMTERGLPIAHTTILRWVRQYAPEFDKRWSRFATSAGTSWRVDETYVRIRGRWAYLYRAVDASGKTVDFRLSPRRNVASAKLSFERLCALSASHQRPSRWTVTLPLTGPFANFESRERLPDLAKLRSSKYLNNLIQQDHRNIKSRLGAMLGLKSFAFAATTIRGVELMHRNGKDQFDVRALTTQGQTPSEIWAAVLAA